MDKQEFIEKIAEAVKKYAGDFGICVYSPIIAQACLESAYGTSYKAQRNNFFGLKYRPNRVNCYSGFFYDDSSEQNADGTYTPISTAWYMFENLEMGVKGYLEFLNIDRYKNLKGITEPRKYLETLKENGYATQHDYVERVMKTIETNNLTRFDKKEEKEDMSNSKLINYTKISPNKTSPRNHKIDTITIHCMAGNLTVESCGNLFSYTSRQASSNYGIGSDGRIGLYVDEKDRSWCSSSASNDNRAVTIEVANDGGADTGWHVSDKAMASLIELIADICRRNDIKELKWKADKKLIGNVEQQNMTVHRWFAAKACPGDYLYNKHSYIAEQVNNKLGINETKAPVTVSGELYRVRKSWNDAGSQLGAYGILDNAIKACKNGYSVFDSKGNIVYPIATDNTYKIKITASTLNIRKSYTTLSKVVGTVSKNEVYTIIEEKNGWGKLKSGAGWIKLSYTEKV
ncbi:N-acetylmuramoyl-L-alanine amidase [uncultured Clostridium sp.]|uniref:N-acetylmuramoyl-L-alanine amidase n=1 Tax=uncultured Clostridium sp. TaxID=59620 RepID=UPI00260DF61E|nr:glucosaminidase domain-containing protein [uncultured Clostridium sp.]